ncbi:MAG: hypothetical protein MI861_22970 [Pirellulales bacterium]|nr:hypothetical protein [Pirellulales bacterium]
MRNLLSFLSVFAAIFMLILAGCKQQSSTTTTPAGSTPSSQTAADEHGHGHAEGGTDHGAASHAHGAGPHDGTVTDWGGGKYHVEFTVDHDKQEATVYVLGSDEKTPSPIAAAEIELAILDPEMQVTLKASPQEGDPEGSASRFIGKHEKLGVVQAYAGTITGLIDDTPYSGDFKEVAHDHQN